MITIEMVAEIWVGEGSLMEKRLYASGMVKIKIVDYQMQHQE